MPPWGLEGGTKTLGQLWTQPKPCRNPLRWRNTAVTYSSRTRRGSRDQAGQLGLLKPCDPLCRV